MTTIGDVLMVFGGAIAISFALWATVMIVSLSFPVLSARMAQGVQRRLGRMVLIGLAVSLPVLLTALVLVNVPNPAAKIVGFAMLMTYLGVTAVGSAGIVRTVAERIRETAPEVSHYGATTRAAMLFVAALNVPFVGWFVLAPVCIAASVGSVTVGLFSKGTAPAPNLGGS